MVRVETKSENENGCCGGPAMENTDACCVKDERAKNLGEAGCGCSDKSEPFSEKPSCCS